MRAVGSRAPWSSGRVRAPGRQDKRHSETDSRLSSLDQCGQVGWRCANDLPLSWTSRQLARGPPARRTRRPGASGESVQTRCASARARQANELSRRDGGGRVLFLSLNAATAALWMRCELAPEFSVSYRYGGEAPVSVSVSAVSGTPGLVPLFSARRPPARWRHPIISCGPMVYVNPIVHSRSRTGESNSGACESLPLARCWWRTKLKVPLGQHFYPLRRPSALARPETPFAPNLNHSARAHSARPTLPTCRYRHPWCRYRRRSLALASPATPD